MEDFEWKTTFMTDFAIANKYGKDAIIDTFKRAFEEWKTDVVFCTELCMVMNIYCWSFYEKGNEEWSRLYADYYYKVRDYALDHFKGEDFQYFWRMTD